MRIERVYASTDPVSFGLWDVTGDGFSSEALVAGDVMISVDGATFVNVTNLPTNASGQVRWTPTSGEMSGKEIRVRIQDQAAFAFTAQLLIIETRDHPSAMIPSVLDQVIDVNFSLRKIVRFLLAAFGGKTSGFGAAGTYRFRNPADTKDVITMDGDGVGNRTDVTLDLT